MPEQLTVDIKALENMHDVITAGDIVLAEGVTLITDPEETIANTIAQVVEEEPEELEVEELEEGVEPELVEEEEGVEESPAED